MANQIIGNPSRVLDGNGYVVPGAKMTVYRTGTTTTIAVFADPAGTVAAANPVIADANGIFPQRYVNEAAAKVVITTADDVPLYTLDPAPMVQSAGSSADLISFEPTTEVAATNVQTAIEVVAEKISFGAGPQFEDMDELRADNVLTYVLDSNLTVAPGDIVQTRSEGFTFRVATSGASSFDAITAGGVKMTAVADASGFTNAKAYGARGDGTTDDTASIIKALSDGGNIYFPEGVYRIARDGPDNGGAYVSTTKDLRVVCHQNARFVADDLDNDMVRISIPTGGAGLPAKGVIVEWHGGYFDQSAQRVSTVVPFLPEYPPPSGLTGTSGTCDGLSVRGSYESGGIEYSGIKRCVISGVTTFGGDHWQIAGGDSGIFVDGCEEQHVFGCTNIGNRDLGIYASGSPTGTLRARTIIENNLHVNCFHGSSIKRSTGYSRITGNHAENCVRGYLIDKLIGAGHTGVIVSQNSGNKCGTFIRARDCVGFTACENQFTSIGALLSDGTTVEPEGDSVGVSVGDGSTRGIIANNVLSGRTAGLATAYPTHDGFIKVDTGISRITFRGNIGNDIRVLGIDDGTNNLFIDNIVYSAITSPHMTVVGTGSFEQRRDPTDNYPSFRGIVGFADGTVSAPGIMRGSQPNTGIYFTANEVRLSGGGVNNFRVSNTGVGFFGNVSTRNAYGAPTGTATRTTFATGSVTTAQLAERVKALIDDLQAFGLLG